jgi:hypothetical protein
MLSCHAPPVLPLLKPEVHFYTRGWTEMFPFSLSTHGHISTSFSALKNPLLILESMQYNISLHSLHN